MAIQLSFIEEFSLFKNCTLAAFINIEETLNKVIFNAMDKADRTNTSYLG